MPNNNVIDAEFIVPLTYLTNFCIFLDLSLFNCDIELDLKWTKVV